MNDSRRRVFISYSHSDGSSIAARLQADLHRSDVDVWRDTEIINGGRVWTRAIETAIDERDTIIALMTKGSYTSEICRAEQLRALRKGKKVIPVLCERDADRPLHLEA